jgi:catechol 2,3-dioxygenase-like lactoylglutathione lyase family enzyme
MVGYVVRDMAAALRFYRLLGLTIPEGVEGEPFVECITPNGYRLSWNTEEMVKGLYPDWVTPTGARLAVAFKCGSPAEVDEIYQRMVDHGYRSHRAPWDAFWDQRYATIEDPDGNPVDLFCPLETRQ